MLPAKTSKFKQAQLSLGLRNQFFDAKFVYSQQQISNPNAFLISLFKQLPSQTHGFTSQDILFIHAFSCEVIQEAAKSLNVPICTTILAQLLFHFFYSRKSFLQYDIRDIMMGSMYLACKSEQTLRKSYQIAMVFDYIFKAYEGQKRINPLEVGMPEYQHIKNKTIMKSQLDILFQLGFQVYRLLDIPHRYMGTLLSLFEKHPKYNSICHLSWKKLNDCYRTTACLYYPHNIIAAACIYTSMREVGASFPQIPWWTLMEAYEEIIFNIQIMILDLQNNKQNITFSQITSRINQIGEKCDIKNVFPVPYYRKIMLEKRGKFRISNQKEDQIIKNQMNQHLNSSKMEENHIDLQKNTGRKIYKIIIDKCSQQVNGVNRQEMKQPTENKSNSKLSVNSKNLLANISQTLQKHETALSKKVQGSISKQIQIEKKEQNDKQQGQQSDDEAQILALAELRKKFKQNNKKKDQKQ